MVLKHFHTLSPFNGFNYILNGIQSNSTHIKQNVSIYKQLWITLHKIDGKEKCFSIKSIDKLIKPSFVINKSFFLSKQRVQEIVLNNQKQPYYSR